MRSQERRVTVALHDLRADRIRGEAELRHDRRLDLRAELAVRAHRAAELAGGRSAAAARSLRRSRSSSNAHVASFRPSVIGSAWTEWVRPIITVPACSRALRANSADQLVQLRQQQVRRGAALQRQRRIHHIARRQPEMQVSAFLPNRLGDLVDEGDDVVVGGLLQLGDAGNVDAAALLDGRDRLRGHDALVSQGMERGDLDPQHVLEARLVGPDRGHLRLRVARDHAVAPTSGRPMSRLICLPAKSIRSAAS